MRKHNKKIDYNTEDFDKLSISDLKRVADYWLRQHLLRNANRLSSGYIVCPIKDKGFPESRIHVAHFIDRNVMGLRYDLDNCHLISEQSNMWDAQIPKEGYKSLHHYDYENYLGDVKANKLKERAKDIVVLSRYDYIEIINKFKNE